jgi:hypothetical protein
MKPTADQLRARDWDRRLKAIVENPDAVRELALWCFRLEMRVQELEHAQERRYQADQEVSAHLNGMTYP